MNTLTYIMDCLGNEKRTLTTLKSILKQTEQNFNISFIISKSDEIIKDLITEKLNHLNINYNFIEVDSTLSFIEKRNIALKRISSDYFMFIDAGDILPSYTTGFYLDKIKKHDIVFSELFSKTYSIPQYIDKNLLKSNKNLLKNNNIDVERRSTSTNIIFKTSIIKDNEISFNTDIGTYAEWAFVIDALYKSKSPVYYYNFPLYYRDENNESLDILIYAENDFDDEFRSYVKNFIRYIDKSHNENVRQFMINDLKEKIETEFDPHHPQIDERYKNNKDVLELAAKFLNKDIFNKNKPFFNIEMYALMRGSTGFANRINDFRYKSRLLRHVLTGHKTKNRSKYELTNKYTKVDPQTIVFESFGGQAYSDSPKAIYEYMVKAYPQYNYKWILRKPNSTYVPKPAEKIKRSSKKYYEAYSKAGFWVSNARTPLHLYKKENQTYIQTWHGTPLKRLGNDMAEVKMPGTNTEKYKRNFRNETKRWDVLISPNAYSTEIFQSAFWMDSKDILEIGYPRNDVLVNKQNDQKYIEKIKRDLNIPNDKKVILYAPTWRDDEYIQKGKYQFELKINLPKMYEEIGDDYVILLRMHYLIANQIDIKGYEDFAIDVSNYNNVSNLYLISDCLVTDYSSVMFDYGILKRPQIFFAYDLEKYEGELRGFYLDYMKDLPGPITTKADDLIEQLKNIDYIKNEYEDNLNKFYDRFCSKEQGNAAKIIGDMIHNEIQKSLT